MFTKYLEDWREEKTAQEIKTGAVKRDVFSVRKNLRRPVKATSKGRRRERCNPTTFLRRRSFYEESRARILPPTCRRQKSGCKMRIFRNWPDSSSCPNQNFIPSLRITLTFIRFTSIIREFAPRLFRHRRFRPAVICPKN